MIIGSAQEFYKLFKANRPLLGVDYGNKKIGLAISSPNHMISLPYSIIFVKSEQEKLNGIAEAVVKNNICAIVVGLPVNMDGTLGAQAAIVTSFAGRLGKKTGLPIYLQDERLTSRLADSLLKTMGFNRKQRNQRDDLAAASLILETTLCLVRKL